MDSDYIYNTLADHSNDIDELISKMAMMEETIEGMQEDLDAIREYIKSDFEDVS